MFFWNSLTFSVFQQMLAIWTLVPLPFLKPAWTSGSSQFMYCWSLAWRILSITLLVCEMTAIVQLPGASVENPTHGKGHEEEAWRTKARSGLKGPPEFARASTPKPESVCLIILCLSPTPLTLTGGYPWPPFSEKNQLRALANKSPGHEKSVSIQTLC